MASVSYYRTEAERCRALAAHSPDPNLAERWRALAADYQKLADALEKHEIMPMRRVPMQQQPMQQQQAKTEPEDKT